MRPLIETDRLDLWQPRAGEYTEQYAMLSHPDTHEFLGPVPPSLMDTFARALRNAGSWALYGYGVFIVRERGKETIAGTCGVFRSYRGFGKGLDDVPEAGWIIHHSHRGKGYALEAMTAALAWFDHEHGPVRVACMIEEGHAVSLRLAKRLGFAEYDREDAGEGPDPATRPLILLERPAPCPPDRGRHPHRPAC